jgi:hypothetical protein
VVVFIRALYRNCATLRSPGRRVMEEGGMPVTRAFDRAPKLAFESASAPANVS